MGKKMDKTILLLLVFFLVGIFLIIFFNTPSMQISGVVIKVEYNVDAGGFMSAPIKQTIVKFKDGRVKVFDNIKGVIVENKMNIIHHSRSNEIVFVETR